MDSTTGVALYLRVSTEDQDLEGQERELRAYAAVQGWTVIAAYREKASASGRVEREQFDLLRRDSCLPETRGFDHVLVWALDRWSRDPSFVKAVGSIEELEILGIQFHSFKEPQLDSTPDGEPNLGRDLLRAILPTIAAFEARRRSERTRLAMQEIKEGRRTPKGPVGRPRRVTPELAARVLELRARGSRTGGPLPWKQVAIRAGLPEATCRKVPGTLRGKPPHVVNGPGEFRNTTAASEAVPPSR
ncbi:MAG TPA: recombinase family protein [Thermoplasmata archaeon]|nr:recombinase family protein [Thermoplasmata archaeon]